MIRYCYYRIFVRISECVGRRVCLCVCMFLYICMYFVWDNYHNCNDNNDDNNNNMMMNILFRCAIKWANSMLLGYT